MFKREISLKKDKNKKNWPCQALMWTEKKCIDVNLDEGKTRLSQEPSAGPPRLTHLSAPPVNPKATKIIIQYTTKKKQQPK